MMQLAVDVQVACDGDGIPSEHDIHDWVDAALRQSGRPPRGKVELSVRIVDAEEMRALNKLYRQQDKATNVLSFPAGVIDGLPDDAGRLLGDIVICASVVAAEAGAQDKALADHWSHMLVHGTLHLQGFDHETDEDAAEMEALEADILASRNVTNPYAGT